MLSKKQLTWTYCWNELFSEQCVNFVVWNLLHFLSIGSLAIPCRFWGLTGSAKEPIREPGGATKTLPLQHNNHNHSQDKNGSADNYKSNENFRAAIRTWCRTFGVNSWKSEFEQTLWLMAGIFLFSLAHIKLKEKLNIYTTYLSS